MTDNTPHNDFIYLKQIKVAELRTRLPKKPKAKKLHPEVYKKPSMRSFLMDVL